MARGRPRKPTSLHKLEGTFENCVHGNRVDELLAIGSPVKPDWLTGPASECWDLVVGGLPSNATATIDGPMLEALCFWYAEFRYCAAKMHAVGTNPMDEMDLLKRCERATKLFGSAACRFGMTPSDRAKLTLLPANSKETDPLLLMLRNRSRN